MRQKLLYLALITEALLCSLAVLFFGAESAAAVFTEPLSALGGLLRAMSLSGGAGNAAAVAIYFALCLSPLLLLLPFGRGFQSEDWLIFALCAAMFAAVYLAVNPSLLNPFTPQMVSVAGGGVLLSIAAAYCVLRLLRRADGESPRLMRMLSWLIIAAAFIFVYAATGGNLAAIRAEYDEIRAANSSVPAINYIFLALKFAVAALPNVLSALAAVTAAELLRSAPEERAERCLKLAGFCKRSLMWTVLCGAGFNVLQFLCVKLLLSTHINVQFPVFSLVFVFALLLAARLFSENHALRRDNDLFI
jgi:hypothetical protein